jgi:CheY-like chemotaxis protein
MTQRVLVVDDEWLILDFTRSALEDLGCEVVTASNAADALHRLRTDVGIDLLSPTFKCQAWTVLSSSRGPRR